MLDWADGTGTARFWILKMMIDALGGSETLKSVVETTVRQQQQHVYAKGFAIRDAKCAGSDLEHCPLLRRVVLLVNRGNTSTTIEVRGATGSNASVVDYSAGHGHIPYSSAVLGNDTVTLTGYAVHLLTTTTRRDGTVG